MKQSMEEKKTAKVVKYARRGQWQKLVHALDEGASVNATDKERRSALFFAALNGNKKCLKELLRRGADPNQRTLDGQTACHAVAVGGRSPGSFTSGMMETRNPLFGLLLGVRGVFNLLAYYLRDAQLQCSCLEYLVQYGGDLRVQSFSRETTRDIAVRMRKMNIVTLVENYYDLQSTPSGYTLKNGQSMLRPTNSYPRSCPHWMHTVASSISLEDMSPLNSRASLYHHGRCTNVYDYGFVHPYGSRTSPGSIGAVPEVLFSEINKCSQLTHGADGSIWQQGYWGGQPVTVRQFMSSISTDLVLFEMDTLSLLRHPNIALLMAVSCGPTESNFCLLLEPLHTHSLHHQLHHQYNQHSIPARMNIIIGVATALDYLHSIKGLAHCILSSHAVHLTPNNTPKLCNMYCCQPPDTCIQKGPHLLPFLPWMAPELIQHLTTSHACDVYSLGVLMWEVWEEEQPWAGLSPVEVCQVVVKEGQRLPINRDQNDLAPILDKCLGPPSQRTSITHLSKLLNITNQRLGKELHQLTSEARLCNITGQKRPAAN